MWVYHPIKMEEGSIPRKALKGHFNEKTMAGTSQEQWEEMVKSGARNWRM